MVKSVKAEDTVGRVRTQEELSFEFGNKTLVFVRDMKSFHQHTFRRNVQNVNMTKHTYHFWGMGLNPGELLNTIEVYIPSLYIGKFPFYQNVVSKNPHPFIGKRCSR